MDIAAIVKAFKDYCIIAKTVIAAAATVIDISIVIAVDRSCNNPYFNTSSMHLYYYHL